MDITREQLWSYRPQFGTGLQACTGYDVKAVDGAIGEIDETTAQAGRNCLVVNTGRFFGTKRMIPAGCITEVDHFEHVVTLNMTKDQIKHAPEFDPDRMSDDTHWGEHEQYYREAPATWW